MNHLLKQMTPSSLRLSEGEHHFAHTQKWGPPCGWNSAGARKAHLSPHSSVLLPDSTPPILKSPSFQITFWAPLGSSWCSVEVHVATCPVHRWLILPLDTGWVWLSLLHARCSPRGPPVFAEPSYQADTWHNLQSKSIWSVLPTVLLP